MRLLSRSRELKRLDSIFKTPRHRAVDVLESVLWLRAGKAEAVRKVQLLAPSRRPSIDFGRRRAR